MGMCAKMNWPIADRDLKWDAGAAHKRILDWCSDKDGNVNWKQYASVHFWCDTSAPDPDEDGLPDRQGDYKLPFCDVVDGEVKALPRAIFKVAAVLDSKGVGGVDIPHEDEKPIRDAVDTYYELMKKEFKDDSITPPWNQKRSIRRFVAVGDLRAVDPTVGDESNGKITGHAAVYNQKANIGDWFYEIIRSGAFDSADLTDVPFLVNHDMDGIPLARSRRNNGNSTMTLSTDNVGLAFDATLDIENNDKSKSLYSAISRGDIDKMSYCFSVADEEWSDLDTDMPTRTITKIAKVFEISAVNWPAYDGTDLQTSSRDLQTLESARTLLESSRSTLESEKREMDLLKLKCQILAGG
jgi:uncharacterized protein